MVVLMGFREGQLPFDYFQRFFEKRNGVSEKSEA